MPVKGVETFLADIGGGEVHIVGLSGSEGYAILRFLLRHGVRRIVAHDLTEGEAFARSFHRAHVALPRAEREAALAELFHLPVTFRLGDAYLRGLERAGMIFVGQNWFNHPANFPAIPAAMARGIPLSSAIELYFRLVPCPIVGVTGSVGKSTTATLLHHLLGEGERKVHYTGNDRYAPQLLHEIEAMEPNDLLLLEISNRHLTRLTASPHIAVLTNIRPNHLEEHGDFESYRRTKLKIFRNQGKEDAAVVNAEDPACRGIETSARRYGFGILPFPGEGATIEHVGKEAWIAIWRDGEKRRIAPRWASPLAGRHNTLNILAAVMAADLSGVSPAGIERGLRKFRGLKNRIEIVREVDGFTFVSDLQSTTPTATIAALTTLAERNLPITLIAGGHDKGLSYGELAETIRRLGVEVILLPGSASERLAEGLDPGVPLLRCDDLERAMEAATRRPPRIVLLSPAAAHFYTRFVEGKRGFHALARRFRRGARSHAPPAGTLVDAEEGSSSPEKTPRG